MSGTESPPRCTVCAHVHIALGQVSVDGYKAKNITPRWCSFVQKVECSKVPEKLVLGQAHCHWVETGFWTPCVAFTSFAAGCAPCGAASLNVSAAFGWCNLNATVCQSLLACLVLRSTVWDPTFMRVCCLWLVTHCQHTPTYMYNAQFYGGQTACYCMIHFNARLQNAASYMQQRNCYALVAQLWFRLEVWWMRQLLIFTQANLR